MKLGSTQQAFWLTTALYGSVLAGALWQFQHQTFSEKNLPVRELPIQISMYQAPSQATPPLSVPQPPPMEKIIEEKVVEKPPVEPKVEKKVVEKKVVEKKPPIKKAEVKPKPKPKPLPKKPEPTPVVEKQPEPKPVEVAKATPPPKPAVEAPAPDVVKAPSQPAYSASQVADAEDRYLSELNRTLAKLAKDTYPNRAKRRRWEGEVMLRFVLQKDGRITQLEVMRENRRELLNEAALSIFKDKLQMRFKAFYAEMDRQSWALKVPIYYKVH